MDVPGGEHLPPARLPFVGEGAEYGDLFAEIATYRRTGIDGLFSDNSDIAVAQRAGN